MEDGSSRADPLHRWHFHDGHSPRACGIPDRLALKILPYNWPSGIFWCAATGKHHSPWLMMPPPKFGIVVSVVEPPSQLAWCLHHIRLVYRNCPLIVIEDGPSKHDYPSVRGEFEARFIRGQCLKRAKHGGAWWRRTLEFAVQSEAEFVMKIDPDTKFQRPAAWWPGTDIAGTLLSPGSKFEHIQGGAQLFTRSAAQRILDSGLLSSGTLADPWTHAWNDGLANHSIKTGYLCTDAMLKYLKETLGLSWSSWPEVKCDSAVLPPDYATAAVSHPHKSQRIP